VSCAISISITRVELSFEAFLRGCFGFFVGCGGLEAEEGD
jgi:hypothetical protein